METTRALLLWAQKVLEESSETPVLDTSVLLAHLLGIDRAGIYARYSDEQPGEVVEKFRRLIERRAQGEPVAYLTGIKEFMGYEFKVDPRALIPRPDTEVLVEAVQQTMKKMGTPLRILDLCTGSGCIILSLAKFIREKGRPDDLSASDISTQALDLARENAEHLEERKISWIQSDLLEEVVGPYDIIVTNPPYLTPQETTDALAKGWKEPANALDGQGQDGLDILRRLVSQSVEKLAQGGYLFIEAAPAQMKALEDLLWENRFKKPMVIKDLSGLDRVIFAALR